MKTRKGLTTKGSLTVECGLILPVFIFAIVTFLYLFQIFILHEMLQQAITKEGLELSKYGYVYQYITDYSGNDERNDESTELNERAEEAESNEKAEKVPSETLLKELLLTKNINNAFLRYKLGDYIDKEYIDGSVIKGGMEGLSFYLSEFMGKDDQVDIVLNYYIRPPIILLPVDDFYMMQRVTLRGWNGYRPDKVENSEGEEEEQTYVYITETGNVYHVSESCSHLTRSIKQISFSMARVESNLYGGKYDACELCGEKVDTRGTVYITDTGDRYHSSISCSGLKRTILKIPVSEAGGRSLCKRCGGKK